MQHIQEGRFIDNLWDGIALSDDERSHLSLCSVCQGSLSSLTTLRGELGVARQSMVRPEAEARLFSILEQASQDTPQQSLPQRVFGEMAAWVHALPIWDSRQQVGAMGVRNASQRSYRLVYGASQTEVELMVEPHNGVLRVVGEVIVDDDNAANGMALIELMTSTDSRKAIETQSDESGRFSLEEVPPGRYVLTVMPRYSQMVVIEPLELT